MLEVIEARELEVALWIHVRLGAKLVHKLIYLAAALEAAAAALEAEDEASAATDEALWRTD